MTALEPCATGIDTTTARSWRAPGREPVSFMVQTLGSVRRRLLLQPVAKTGRDRAQGPVFRIDKVVGGGQAQLRVEKLDEPTLGQVTINEEAWHERHAQPVRRRFRHHHELLEARPLEGEIRFDARAFEPLAPGKRPR